MKKILFFLAGKTATQAEIDAFQELLDGQFTVQVRNGEDNATFSNNLEQCDFVAGTVPTEYGAIPVWNPAAELPEGVATVNNTANVSVRNNAAGDPHNAQAVVSGNTLVGVNLGSTVAMVDQSDTVSVRNGAGADPHNATALVTNGVLSGVNLAATVAMVDNSDSLPLQNSAGTAKGNVTATVAAGAVSNVRTPATAAIVTNNEALTVPVTGTYTTTATVTVANGVITGIALS